MKGWVNRMVLLLTRKSPKCVDIAAIKSDHDLKLKQLDESMYIGIMILCVSQNAQKKFFFKKWRYDPTINWLKS